MSDPPDFTGLHVFVDGANMAFPSQHAKQKRPDARWLLTVVASLTDRLPGAQIGVLVDGSIWGWMQRVCERRDMDALREMERSGVLAVTPAHTTADTFLLGLARDHAGVIVSNDSFGANDRQKRGRVSVPILRVTALFGEPRWHPRFLLFDDAATTQPAQITNAEVIARSARHRASVSLAGEPDSHRHSARDSNADTTQPLSPDAPAEEMLDELRASLEEIAGDDERLNFERAASLLALPYGDQWHDVLRQAVGGPAQGRFSRLCRWHLPGWAIDDRDGRRWLVRSQRAPDPSDPPDAPLAGEELPPVTLDLLLSTLDERAIGTGRLDINTTGAWLGSHFGPGFAAFLAEYVGGPPKGRWGRLCRTLPGWAVEDDADGTWLIQPGMRTRATTPAPPPAGITLDNITSWLDDYADGAQRLDHSLTGCHIGNAFRDKWHAFLDHTVAGPKTGRWIRLCEGLLPGWELEVDHHGTRWLARSNPNLQ